MAGIRSHLRHNVVAYLALFFSLSGTAAAMVVTGEMVKDDSLTGADVREPTLAEVPRAASAGRADSAGDADTVDGKHASAFATARKVVERQKFVAGPVSVGEAVEVGAEAGAYAVAEIVVHSHFGTFPISGTGWSTPNGTCHLRDRGEQASREIASKSFQAGEASETVIALTGAVARSLGTIDVVCDVTFSAFRGSYLADLDLAVFATR